MTYNNKHLQKVETDNSGFTPKERHDVIMSTLAEFNKGPQAFSLRWKENSGEYLTGEILLQTPMFWFMKYKWSRSEIEKLFYKAHIVIDSKFDSALQQTFGGKPGTRWGSGHDPNIKNKKQQHKKQSHTLQKSREQLKHVSDFSQWKEPTGNVQSIFIEFPNGNTLKLAVHLIEPVHYIKKQIVHRTNEKYSESQIILFHNDNELSNDALTIEHYGIKNKNCLKLSMGVIKINIEQFDGARLQVINDICLPIIAIKNEIESNIYPLIPAKEQRLYHNKNRVLEHEMKDNDKLLFEYGIKDGDILYLGAPKIWRMPVGNDVYGIFVECPDGNILELNVVNRDVIKYIKMQIQMITSDKYCVNAQKLFFKRNELDNDRQISDYNIVKDDILQLSIGNININVETREGTIINLSVDSHDLIVDVKRMIQDKTGGIDGDYSVEEQRLFNKINDDELIDDNNSLFACGILDNCALYLGGTMVINVRKEDGMIIKLDIDPKDVGSLLKDIIQTKSGVDTSQQYLYFDGIELEDHKQLMSYNIHKNDVIDLKVRYNVFIKSVNDSEIKLDVSLNDNVLTIKKRINQDINVSVKQQYLYFNGSELNDMAKLNAYKIRQNDIIELKIIHIIFIQNIDGSKIKINVFLDDNILTVKERMQQNNNVPIEQQHLYFNDSELNDMTQLNAYKIKPNDIIELKIRYIIFIKNTNDSKIRLDVFLDDTILTIKRRIEQNINIPVKQQHLYFKESELKDMTILNTYNIKDNDIIELKVRYIIFIQKPDGAMMELNVSPNDNILYIKQQMQNISETPISVHDQILKFNDNILDDDQKPFNEYNIINNSVIMLSIKINKAKTPQIIPLSSTLSDNVSRKKKKNKKKSKKLKKSKKNKHKKSTKKKKRKKTVTIKDDFDEMIDKMPTPNFGLKRSFSAKNVNSVFDYEELFGNNYDNDGELIMGAISSTKTKSNSSHDLDDFNDLMIGKITTPQMGLKKSFSSKNLNRINKLTMQRAETTKPMGYDIDSVFDMTEIDSIVNDLNINNKNINNINGLPYNEYDSDELSSYDSNDSNSYKHIENILIQSSMDDNLKQNNKNINKNKNNNTIKTFEEIEKEIEYDKEDEDTKIAFQNERKHDFDNLMDGFFSDDDNQSLILDEEKEIRMSLKELMKMFKLKTNDELYEYYNKELNIEYANDLVNYLPTIITQPEKFKSTKTRMLLTKMSKYVMNKVLSNQWNGNKANEWMELETNTVTYTFSPPPPPINKIMDVKNDYIKSENIYFENEIEKKK